MSQNKVPDYDSIIRNTASERDRRQAYADTQLKYAQALYEMFEYYLSTQYGRVIVPWELRTPAYKDEWRRTFGNMLGATPIATPYNRSWFWHWRTASLDLKEISDHDDATLKAFHRNYAPLAEGGDFTWVKSITHSGNDA